MFKTFNKSTLKLIEIIFFLVPQQYPAEITVRKAHPYKTAGNKLGLSYAQLSSMIIYFMNLSVQPIFQVVRNNFSFNELHEIHLEIVFAKLSLAPAQASAELVLILP